MNPDSSTAAHDGRKQHSFLMRILDNIEKVGNKLPHPATLFAIFALIVIIVSEIVYRTGSVATHPGTGETIRGISLLNPAGLRFIFSKATDNFVYFPPLGIVLVAMIGIGVAEGSGLISALLRHLVTAAPKRLVTAAVIAAGVLSHLASSAGYVVLIPLGAMVFAAFKRHPLAGMAAAFCGVSGGFGANFLIGSVDPILAGLSESAANLIDSSIRINPAVNFYFMLASAFMIVIVGTWITEKFVEPRLGKYGGEIEEFEHIEKRERKGLIWAGVAVAFVIAVLLVMILPENGILRNPETGSILHSPFMDGLITAILVFFLVPGLAYGIAVGSIRSDKDVIKQMTKSMKGLAGYIVLVFFAGQFVYYFKESNIGVLLAINGAQILKNIGFTGIPLLISFVLVSAFINLFMGSASAKWAIMAPIFVPMFMLLGYHPGITQAAFRIGDSITNIITPMMSYFALIVAFAQKYNEKYGIGTIIATMLPYSVAFGIFWIILLTAWMLLGLPTGPDAPLHMP
ncbi:MAG: AbgT family transporter [Candidatus Latescibacteria bacterium]|nr:AbgT family transporter [bacterium]MBD3423385.1 AbgT family transporter [Candidatus Latescibacterota bacterium]